MNLIKLFFIIIFFLIPQSLFGVTEQATFHSFYVESSSIGWIVALMSAIISGAFIFLTGGTASPIVVSIGTWIGNMAGLSGIAATNYGLALLGGGAIASGGLGIAGGVAVLTAALTFSTEVVVDYGINVFINHYSYKKFVEYSKKLPTLPVPINKDGSKLYIKIINQLNNKIDKNQSLSSFYNQRILVYNLHYMLNYLHNDTSEFNIKNLSLISYLYFVTNDYKNAKIFALKSIYLARKYKVRRTFPAFIFATSSLYDNDIDIYNINKKFFSYSILAESDNKLIPLMFSIYLDRVLYRMNYDNSLDYKILNNIKDIAFRLDDSDIRNQSLLVIMLRYFIKIKLDQQKILSLAKSDNSVIKNSPKTLKVLENTLLEYKHLLTSLQSIFNNKDFNRHLSNNKTLNNIYITYTKYVENTKYLELLISNLRNYQQSKYLK